MRFRKRVKWLEKIRSDMGLTRYGLARALNVPTQSIDHMEIKGQSIKVGVLCDLVRLYAGMMGCDITKAWIDIGRMMEAEHGGKRPPRR